MHWEPAVYPEPWRILASWQPKTLETQVQPDPAPSCCHRGGALESAHAPTRPRGQSDRSALPRAGTWQPITGDSGRASGGAGGGGVCGAGGLRRRSRLRLRPWSASGPGSASGPVSCRPFWLRRRRGPWRCRSGPWGPRGGFLGSSRAAGLARLRRPVWGRGPSGGRVRPRPWDPFHPLPSPIWAGAALRQPPSPRGGPSRPPGKGLSGLRPHRGLLIHYNTKQCQGSSVTRARRGSGDPWAQALSGGRS